MMLMMKSPRKRTWASLYLFALLKSYTTSRGPRDVIRDEFANDVKSDLRNCFNHKRRELATTQEASTSRLKPFHYRAASDFSRFSQALWRTHTGRVQHVGRKQVSGERPSRHEKLQERETRRCSAANAFRRQISRGSHSPLSTSSAPAERGWKID